jgi:hypothetical protein
MSAAIEDEQDRRLQFKRRTREGRSEMDVADIGSE